MTQPPPCTSPLPDPSEPPAGAGPPSELLDRVRRYVDQHRDVASVSRVCWQDDRWTLYIGFATDHCHHLDALRALADEPDRIKVFATRRPPEAVRELRGRLRADWDWWAEHGIQIRTLSTDATGDRVKIGVAESPHTAANQFAAHYSVPPDALLVIETDPIVDL